MTLRLTSKENTNPVQLVRDVSKHHSGADIAAVEDALTTDTVMLVVRMVMVRRSRVLVRRRPIANETALVVDTRLGTVGRVQGTLSGPEGWANGAPLEGLLQVC